MPKQAPQRRIDSRAAVRSTSISGITLSAPAPTAVPIGAAGDGLIWDGGVLSVGAGLGITVNADDVALTTPGTLSASTGNSASGSHTHSIDSTIARSAVTLTAGAGLTGGGDLTANRTFDIGAGLGITVNADDVALTTPGTLSASTGNSASGSHTHSIDSTIARSAITLTAGAGLTGGGDLTANRTFDIGAGTLIAVGANDVSLAAGTAQYQVPVTGASPFTPAYTALSAFAGAGLAFASGTFAVGAGAGLTVNADDVALTTPGTLSASTSNSASGSHTHAITANVAAVGLSVSTTGTVGTSASLARSDHTHAISSSSNPGATASLLASTAAGDLTLVRLEATTRLRSPRLDTTSGNLTIAPAGDVLLQPGNLRTLLAGSTALQSDNYASQLTGMRVTADGEGDFRYLYADELHAKSFIADLEQALAGGQIIAKSVAIVAKAFTLPTAGTTPVAWQVNFFVRDLPSAPGMAVFENGDWVAFRQFWRSAGELIIGWAWGTVSGYLDQADGTQQWTWTRSTANPGLATGVIQADSLALDFGVSGNGYYEVNAIDGPRAINSPYARVVTWSGHPSSLTVRAHIGNLRGLFSANNEFGLYAGDGTGTTNSYLRLSNQANQFRNLITDWYSNTTKIIQIDPTYGIDILSANQSSGTAATAAAAGYKITFTKSPGSGTSSQEVGYLVGTHDGGYSRLNLGSISYSSMESSLRLDVQSGGYNPSLTLSTNGSGTSALSLMSASLGIGTTSPTSQLTINSSFATTSGLTISGENASDSQIIARRAANKTAFSVLAWENQVHLGAGVYYDNDGWLHHNSNSNSQLFALTPGTGVQWWASNNSTSNWNVANGLLLWNDIGSWKSLVQSTASGNSYFTGGNVGIGATNPEASLQVRKDSSVANTDNQIAIFSDLIGSPYITIGAGSNTGGYVIYNQGGSAALGLGAHGNLATINIKNNNVGIGTTNPAYKLDVNGSARATSLDITGGGGQIAIYDRDGTGAFVLYDQSDIFKIYNGATDIMQLASNGTLTLTNTLNGTNAILSGDVGIGTTSPAAKLHVVGEFRTSGVTSGLNLVDRASTSTWKIFHAGNWLNWHHNDVSKMTLTQTGDLSIPGDLSADDVTVGTKLTVSSTAGSLGTWSNINFGTGWGNFGSGYQACQYRRLGDLVMLRGLAKLNSGTAVTIATLPSDHRPTAGRLIFITAAGNAAAWTRIDVLTDGKIEAVGGGTSFSYCSLDPIVFSIS